MDNRAALELYEQGRALRAAGRFEAAADAYRRALALEPAFPEAANNLGNCLRIMWELDEAEAAYRSALAARPGFAEAWNNLGATLKNLGRADEALECFERAVDLQPSDPALHSNLVFARNYSSVDDRAPMDAEERRWHERHGQPWQSAARPTDIDRSPGRRLRVGYVSGGFREQAQSFFTVPLFELHDRQAFEIIAYSDAAQEDAVTRRLRAATAQWRPIAGLSDDEAAEQIRRDRIDILVDLTAHSGPNRLPVFARKPAAVQASWLGYPGGSGLPAMDYRLTDPWLEPTGESGRSGAEIPLRLADTFWCYDPLIDDPARVEGGQLPSRRNGVVTFGCLNNFSKTNGRTFALWARVLQAVPGSRLLLLAPRGSARRRALEALGVGAERIDFVEFQPRISYLQTYQRIDLCLDTFPCNGHTTSLDSWWMGVPVVSLRGQTPVSRAGYSFAQNLGLPEFAAGSADDYVAVAAGWAQEKARLASLRAGLRERMSCSPLMDRPRFARAMESAYRAMWAAYLTS